GWAPATWPAASTLASSRGQARGSAPFTDRECRARSAPRTFPRAPRRRDLGRGRAAGAGLASRHERHHAGHDPAVRAAGPRPRGGPGAAQPPLRPHPARPGRRGADRRRLRARRRGLEAATPRLAPGGRAAERHAALPHPRPEAPGAGGGDEELDVRRLVPAERHRVIFAAWHALAPGAAYVLVNDHDPKPL